MKKSTDLHPIFLQVLSIVLFSAVGQLHAQSMEPFVNNPQQNPPVDTTTKITAQTFGTPLGSFSGVVAYSNGSGTFVGPDTGTYGIPYQCVEYVIRYYAQHYGFPNMKGNGNGSDLFTNLPAAFNLKGYANGGIVSPQVGDILCFAGGSGGNGHAAIVRDVNSTQVTVIQQNVTNDYADTAFSFALSVAGGHYTVDASRLGSSYSCQGWLRAAATNFWQVTNGPGGAVQALAVDPNGDVFAGTANGGVYRSTDNANTWVQSNTGLADTSVSALAVGSTGYIVAGTTGDGVFISTNGGTSWTQTPLTSVYVTCLATEADTIYAGDGHYCTGIYRSTDKGASWLNVTSICVNGIAINSKGVIFATSGTAGAYRSSDEGSTWQQINSGLTNNGTAIVIDATDRIFVGTQTNVYTGVQGDGVFRSTNNGDSWTAVNSGLTASQINSLALNGSGNIFAGADNGKGIFYSTDAGNSWTNVSSGISDTSSTVSALVVNKAGYVFAAAGDTVYRSIGTITSVKQTPPMIASQYLLSQNYPNPFNPSTTISYQLPTNTLVVLKVFDVLGREVETLVNERQSAGSHSVRFKAANLPSGVYFYRLQAGVYHDTKKLLLLK